VKARGTISLAGFGVVIATHAQRFRPDQADRAPRARVARRARDVTAELTVTQLANGVVSFAAMDYQAGRPWARQSIDVSIVAGSVQLARDGMVIRVRPIRHDRPARSAPSLTPMVGSAARTQPSEMSSRYRNLPGRPGART